MEETCEARALAPTSIWYIFLGEVLGPDYEIAITLTQKNPRSLSWLLSITTSAAEYQTPLTDWAAKLIDEKGTSAQTISPATTRWQRTTNS